MGFLADLLSKLRGGAPSGDADNGGRPEEPGVISCQEALGLLFEYLDGELEEVSEEEVAKHLDVCKKCYPRFQFENAFLEAVRKAQAGDVAPDSVRERILGVLEAEGLDSE